MEVSFMTKEEYLFLKGIIKRNGNCYKMVDADCKKCLFRTETNPDCGFVIAVDEATDLISCLSEEDVFELLL